MAVGIVAFALVAMMALLGSMLGNARDASTQNNALQLVPSVNEYLKRTGFTNVYGWSATPSSHPLVFAYTVETNNRIEPVITNVASAGALPATANTRTGRLFQVKVALSTNNPAGITTLPAMNGYTNFALPLRVDIYNTPQATVTASSNNLVLSYETAVFR